VRFAAILTFAGGPNSISCAQRRTAFGRLRETPMSGYALDNSWDRAKRRLALLEYFLDPKTKRRMQALGVSQGWNCLEIAAGGGSIARWLSEAVGDSGKVLATDINTALLKGLSAPNLETRDHDILTEDLPEAAFDIVHCRWLLHHLPTPEVAIERMIKAVRPGGWLLLEEVDFFPVHASSNADYSDFMSALVNTVVSASGRDCFWARALPVMVAERSLVDVTGVGGFSLLQGGGEEAEFFVLTAEQMRDRMLESQAIDEAKLSRALALLADPAFWAFGGGEVAVWGRKAA
jgi:2-polyprenyl-3-methyl-5-hydroxy-6-metoxy-1,4-benzoquinol methylase